MAPRSSWKGFLRLSLVSVPVKAFTANSSDRSEIALNQLHKECHSRIRYQKVCPIHGEVEKDEIVSGYEYTKGQYVEVNPDEVEKLRPESDKSVSFKGFIPAGRIDAMYFKGRSYFLVPDGPMGQKPYTLLRECMVEEDVHAIGEVVISGREQLVLLRPHEQLLSMSVLSLDSQVKKAAIFEDEIVKTDYTEDEVKLTKMLIDATKLDEFDYSEFKDDYVEKLTALIQAKVEGSEIVTPPAVEERPVVNLLEALKQSVAEASKSSKKMATSGKKKTQRKVAGSSKRVAKKMAPSGSSVSRPVPTASKSRKKKA